MLSRLSVLLSSATVPPLSLVSLPPPPTRQLDSNLNAKRLQEAGALADLMTHLLIAPVQEKVHILAAWDVKDRVKRTLLLLTGHVDSLKQKIKATGNELPVTNAVGLIGAPPWLVSRNNTLKYAALHRTLPAHPPGPPRLREGSGSEVDDLGRRLDEANLPAEAHKVAQKELKRLMRMNSVQAEYSVLWNYLELLTEIPWNSTTPDRLGSDTLAIARKHLDDDHYGLEKVKKRLLEYLAVLRLKKSVSEKLDAQRLPATAESISSTTPASGAEKAPADDAAPAPSVSESRYRKVLVDRSPILLFVGPPGTGKTALSKSIATALGREFHRISLGGVRDEAAIRGHRRTYVAAMPGLFVNGLRKVGVANPVFLLDEIDKLGMANFHGDPSAAMLEVLDPEQNHTFRDHYLGIPIDLSKVLFIATANSLDTIPPPLLDRMETIVLSGYTTLEKRQIARRHLIPKQIVTNGLQDEQVRFDDNIIDKIVSSYTREAGVRNLEREVGAVCRAKAVAYANAMDVGQPESYRSEVSLTDVEDALGIERFEEEVADRSSRPGVVTGLVAYRSGGNGSILFIEVTDMPGSGRVQLTGKLGDVLKESVEVALSWVKAHAYTLRLTTEPTEDLMKNRSIHVHCPAGAIPKDGPSAGLAHAIALISLFSAKPVPPTLAMTGELSLRGRVTAVGGIKEKLIGASRAGVRTVLLPAANRKDTKDLPLEVRAGLTIIYVQYVI